MQFDNFIIKLNHRATISNYFPLIWKIVHRTVHDIGQASRLSREENNKAFSSSYLSPRISSRNCKGPGKWRAGMTRRMDPR